MNLEDKAVRHLKTGGRKKRGPTKFTDAGELAASSVLPLDYMLSVMRDPAASPKLRQAMAAKALPYCHAPYKSVEPPRPAPDLPSEITIRFIEPDGRERLLRPRPSQEAEELN
jgi:hypothetical protein